jgi:hypothetical protein
MRGTIEAGIALCLAAIAVGDEPQAPALKEPVYRSAHPLYFRVAFGSSEGRSMLGVLDEGDGTGKGYSLVYLDENMNRGLTPAPPRKTILLARLANSAGFEITGPFAENKTAEYTLYLFPLPAPKRPDARAETAVGIDAGSAPTTQAWWDLKADGWNYMFINGQMGLYTSAAEALKGKPVVLGGKCAWEIASRTQQGKQYVSAALKDENGCTLRILSGPHRNPTPQLTLLKDGEKVFEQKMEFG